MFLQAFHPSIHPAISGRGDRGRIDQSKKWFRNEMTYHSKPAASLSGKEN
jgi:hypothetical protein